MDDETRQAIEKSKGRLAWYEKRLQDLKLHLAGLPSVGCHRPEFLRTQRVIQFVKKAHEEEHAQLEWLFVAAREAEDFEEKYGKVDPAWAAEADKAYAEYQKERLTRSKERERREVEAERRRAQFRVIPGGRG